MWWWDEYGLNNRYHSKSSRQETFNLGVECHLGTLEACMSDGRDYSLAWEPKGNSSLFQFSIVLSNSHHFKSTKDTKEKLGLAIFRKIMIWWLKIIL